MLRLPYDGQVTHVKECEVRDLNITPLASSVSKCRFSGVLNMCKWTLTKTKRSSDTLVLTAHPVDMA